MKKFTHLSGSRWLFVFCFFIPFMVLPAFRMSAQTLQQEAPQTFNWKTEDAASAVLMTHIQQLSQQMPSYTEGTSLYDNALRRTAYFKEMVKQIGDGAAVEDAVELALPAAATLGFSKEASYTSKVVLHALHEEARIMLTN